jgi:hypothetical protein
MKAKDFINEAQQAEMHAWHQRCIGGMRAMPDLDQYYDLYRFGMAMASAGRDHPVNGDAYGHTGDSPTTLSYTDGEEKIVDAALKKMGKSSKRITTQKSEEPVDTNTKSIVGTRKPLPRRT